VTHSSAADSVQKLSGGPAPRGWVLLKRREGVREVLETVANRARARFTGGEVTVRTEQSARVSA
jgi:hypothetical protein